MYSREVAGTVRSFEASGGLYHNALVMRDREKDSYWAIVSSEAIAGPDRGTPLRALPVAEKMTWSDWRERHPDTLVLSVGGREHVPEDPYASYFRTGATYRDARASDGRLADKEAIFGFLLDGRPFAVRLKVAEDGFAGEAAGRAIFLFRPRRAPIFMSTKAFLLERDGRPVALHRKGGVWIAPGLGRLDPETGRFENGAGPLPPLQGIDTFWYVWSPYHPGTRILGPA